MLRRVLISVVAAAAVATSCSGAFAADLAARTYNKALVHVDPGYNWSGFYIGGHIGSAWIQEPATYLGTTGIPLDPVGTVYSANRNGFLGGLQAGYSYQMQNIVLGVTGDFSWTNASIDNATTAVFFPAATVHTLARTNWYGTIAGRLGFAVNNVLLYAKGGVAFTEETYGGNAVAGGAVVSSFNNLTSTRTGYVVGAGIEYGISPNWTVFAEYNYLDFGTRNYTLVSTTAGFTVNLDVKDRVDMFKGGLNYKFGGPVVARY
jgi:outer membrane immunogenic protein